MEPFQVIYSFVFYCFFESGQCYLFCHLGQSDDVVLGPESSSNTRRTGWIRTAPKCSTCLPLAIRIFLQQISVNQ